MLEIRLSREQTSSKTVRPGSAAALLIALGYPGEIATDFAPRGHDVVDPARSTSSGNCSVAWAGRCSNISLPVRAIWCGKQAC